MRLVAIQGIYGSYSEAAAQQMVGAGAELIECRDFASTFQAVLSKGAERAVVPPRNKVIGEIEGVSDLIDYGGFEILDEFDLQITHVLAGIAAAAIEDVTTVRSHREALRQCSEFLDANPRMKPVSDNDTATSIRRIVGENFNCNAAIGSERAALFYGAKILSRDVADEKDNWTTFGLIGRQ